MKHLKRFNENADRVKELEVELNEIWSEEHPWIHKKVMLTDTAEDLKYYDRDRGKYALAKIWFKDFLQGIKMVQGYKGNKNDISFVDKAGKIWMCQYSKNGHLNCVYSGMFGFLTNECRIGYEATKEIIKSTMEEHFEIKVIIPEYNFLKYNRGTL